MSERLGSVVSLRYWPRWVRDWAQLGHYTTDLDEWETGVTVSLHYWPRWVRDWGQLVSLRYWPRWVRDWGQLGHYGTDLDEWETGVRSSRPGWTTSSRWPTCWAGRSAGTPVSRQIHIKHHRSTSNITGSGFLQMHLCTNDRVWNW